jgi:hypothetical protein
VLLRLEKKWNTGNALIKNLKEMLNSAGLRGLDEFRVANAQQNGKTFESFFLQMECFAEAFSCPD